MINVEANYIRDEYTVLECSRDNVLILCRSIK